jgi:polyisoprenoid-binding protein YceI
LVPEQSAVIVNAKSSLGPISFGTMTLEGRAEFAMSGVDLDSAVPVSAIMKIPLISLESDNKLYDSELRRRLDSRRFPLITVQMHAARAQGGGRFEAEGDLTIHATTRRLTGVVELAMWDENTMIVTGSEDVDMREFDIDLPSILVFKIYPEVNVQFRLTATRARPGDIRRADRGISSRFLRRLGDLRPGRPE